MLAFGGRRVGLIRLMSRYICLSCLQLSAVYFTCVCQYVRNTRSGIFIRCSSHLHACRFLSASNPLPLSAFCSSKLISIPSYIDHFSKPKTQHNTHLLIQPYIKSIHLFIKCSPTNQPIHPSNNPSIHPPI